MNYYPQRDGQIDALDDGSTTSPSLLQAHLPQSHVVKGFNNIFFQHLRDLAQPLLHSGADGRSALAIAGDDATAKDAVRRAFDAIGYDTLDLGPLAEGWRTQPGQPAYGLQYAKDEADWTAGARPVGTDEARRSGDAGHPRGLSPRSGPETESTTLDSPFERRPGHP